MATPPAEAPTSFARNVFDELTLFVDLQSIGTNMSYGK